MYEMGGAVRTKAISVFVRIIVIYNAVPKRASPTRRHPIYMKAGGEGGGGRGG